ncbi:follitropin subunit beta-like [Chaetodon trifascialis]|uniref:follitropin subunit beta-like n=1 Tax=Chaetodon trifascialis TaxID=109706 RepID=UPI003995A918
MPSIVLTCLLLSMLTGWTVCVCTLKNHTLWIERQDCAQCVAVNITICSGYCYTQDTNLKGRFGRTFLVQRSCVPLSVVYQAAYVPGCPQDVNPQLHYPAAHQCSCRRCDIRSYHCVGSRRFSYDQCTTAPSSVKGQNEAPLET